MAGLAKQFEEVYAAGRADPIRIPRTSEALYLLQQIRDEAHRFAITYHRSLRGKRMTASVLDDIPGLGPGRKKRLVRELGGVNGVKTASREPWWRSRGCRTRWPIGCSQSCTDSVRFMPSAATNGIDIEYSTTGSSDDPALLLIMGLGGQLIAWHDDFVSLLADRGFYVIRYDNRDVGRSTWLDSLGVPDVTAAFAGVPLRRPTCCPICPTTLLVCCRPWASPRPTWWAPRWAG